MNTPDHLRETCAARLLAAAGSVGERRAFLGFDGFVDEIVHVVDHRTGPDDYERLPQIADLAARLSRAAGHSTNIELVVQRTKLGGNGPIMAHALARLGLGVTYVGSVGWPALHPVFQELAALAEVYGIAEPGHTDALEFADGKVMITKTTSLNDVTWANLQARLGHERFTHHFHHDDLIAFVNWTMLPFMSELWAALQVEWCPAVSGPRRRLFFDLADPEKRTKTDILRALELIAAFGRHFEVILGLNEKEAWAVADVIDLDTRDRSRPGLLALAPMMAQQLRVATLLIHPVRWALAVTGGQVSTAAGPFIERPALTTGAGDHFNAGFCLGQLLGFDDSLALLAGVSASGFYVREARSPTIPDLAQLLRQWPQPVP